MLQTSDGPQLRTNVALMISCFDYLVAAIAHLSSHDPLVRPLVRLGAMKTLTTKIKPSQRLFTVLLTVLLTFPLFAACGDSQVTSPAQPPTYDTRSDRQSAPSQTQSRTRVNQGLSNKQKVAILAGAAALYYLYNQHRNRQEQGPEGQYYLSKNGRVYYRDAQHRVHWVTPPAEGIRVPEAEARRYQEFQGYNGRQTGRDLQDLAGSSELAPAY
jgi:hypothetical protein